MKKSLLKLAVLLLLLNIVLIACKKRNELPFYINQGIITANFGYYDCATCGGYYIKFTADTTRLYRTYQDLSGFDINSNSKFPITATIGWKPDTTIKLADFITVTSIKIDN